MMRFWRDGPLAAPVIFPITIAGLEGLPLDRATIDAAGRSWTIAAVADQNALLAASNRFSAFPFGLMLWESAPALAGALERMGGALAGLRVLDLGAGSGLCGIVARFLGGTVTATDHSPEALALCRANATANGIEGLSYVLADWTDWRQDGLYDLIIGADVLYDRDAHGPVLAILDRNLAAGGHVLLADPGRADTPQFVTALGQAGYTVTTETRRVAALAPVRPGQEVDITLIRAART